MRLQVDTVGKGDDWERDLLCYSRVFELRCLVLDDTSQGYFFLAFYKSAKTWIPFSPHDPIFFFYRHPPPPFAHTIWTINTILTYVFYSTVPFNLKSLLLPLTHTPTLSPTCTFHSCATTSQTLTSLLVSRKLTSLVSFGWINTFSNPLSCLIGAIVMPRYSCAISAPATEPTLATEQEILKMSPHSSGCPLWMIGTSGSGKWERGEEVLSGVMSRAE